MKAKPPLAFSVSVPLAVESTSDTVLQRLHKGHTAADVDEAQVESLGKGTSLLIDTFDITEAVRLAVDVAGPELGAVRIDSGDLGISDEGWQQVEQYFQNGSPAVAKTDLFARIASGEVDMGQMPSSIIASFAQEKDSRSVLLLEPSA